MGKVGLAIVILCLSIITLFRFSSGQSLGNFELYYRLESRMDSLNSSFLQQKKQLDQIISEILVQQITQDEDIKVLRKQLTTTEGKVASLEKTTSENSNLLASASVQLLSVETKMSELASRMDKLSVSNEMWRSNFQVVNRTFAELKKKLAYVVPVIPG